MGVAMQLFLVLAVGFVGLVAAQDTYKCPDGWMLEEDRTGCRCFLIGPDEAVTRSTADLVCAGHSGSWVAELDHPGINYWLKARLLARWTCHGSTQRAPARGVEMGSHEHNHRVVRLVGRPARQLRAPRDVSHTLGAA